MNESKEQLRRLAIAVETLATMMLERLSAIESRLTPQHVKRTSSKAYWIKYVIGPIALGITSAILAHLYK